ncbi:MAG: alpha/beta fold hydrolase [Candidatus Nomurabacteria bacterium]|jgi:pimeloyl-ACP methyl ester carboxylesterase|nr:alpha/beta fold hydrolase [Candidatus Nomurabacteria bacterium]
MFDKLIHKTFRWPFELFVRRDIHPKNHRLTLLFLHGLAVDGRFWRDVLSEASKCGAFNNVRLITLDLLGEGKSPAPEWLEYSLDDHMSALEKTVHKLRIKTPLLIVAHSMGGVLAIELARKIPVEKLLLVAPPLMPPVNNRRLLDKLNSASLEILGKMAADNPVLRPIAKFMHSLSTRFHYDVNQVAFRRTMRHIVLENHSMDSIKSLEMPIYLVRGKADLLSNRQNYQKVAKQSNIALTEIPRCGHQIFGALFNAVMKQLADIVK